jgi:hypothetical protein
MNTRSTLAALTFTLSTAWSFGASAQTASRDETKTCETAHYKAAAYTYLTGKPAKSSWDRMETTSSRKLEIDKSALDATLVKDGSDYTVSAFVSVPFSAVSAYARLLYSHLKAKGHTEITVCHYALRESAPSWGRFEMTDLKAITGRTLSGVSSSTSVRLGGSAPPKGYRPSTVAVAFVVSFGDSPTVRLQLESERK